MSEFSTCLHMHLFLKVLTCILFSCNLFGETIDPNWILLSNSVYAKLRCESKVFFYKDDHLKLLSPINKVIKIFNGDWFV